MATWEEKQRQYALEREAISMKRRARADEEISEEIRKVSIRTMDMCRTDAQAWLSKYADQNGISISEARKKASQADLEALSRKAKYYSANRSDKSIAFSPEANREMKLYNFTMKLNRADLLSANLQLNLLDMGDDVEDLIRKNLRETAINEFTRQAGLLGKSIGSPESLKDRAEAIVNASFHETTFSEKIWENQAGLQRKLEEGIIRSTMMGKNPTTWMRTMDRYLTEGFLGTHGSGGIAYALQRLAVTEAARVQISSQKAAYQRAGYEACEILIEPTACPYCQKHDEKVVDLEKATIGINIPPFHPNCRCSTVAHMDRAEIDRLLGREPESKGSKPPERDARDALVEEPRKPVGRFHLYDTSRKDFAAKAYGAKHSDRINKILENADPLARDAYLMLESRFEAIKPIDGKVCYFSGGTNAGKVAINIVETSKGDAIGVPYNTYFHELGHLIDHQGHQKGGLRYTFSSEMYQPHNGLNLTEVAEKEVAAKLKNFQKQRGFAKIEEARENFVAELWDKYSIVDRADLSDILEGAGIGMDFPLGAGHGAAYWEKGGTAGKEAFAEFFAADITQSGSLKVLKEELPETYKAYRDILEKTVEGWG